jgi:hypothetical protein
MAEPPEIDRLIEEGLTLYGHGDLDGALLAWEQALSIDQDNAQANSYVDYVRQNYDLLSGDPPDDESQAPYGIEDEPYQLEVLPAEAAHLKPGTAAMTEVDEGWGVEDDETASGEGKDKEPARADTTDSAPPEFADFELTPGVDPGFSSQPTNLRERDTGFVKPLQPARSKPPTSPPAGRRNDTADPFGGLALPSDQDVPPASANVSLSYDDPPTTERQLSPAAQELINSLPTPTPPALSSRAHSNSSPPRTDTADLPPSVRPPALPPNLPNVSLTITQDFETQQTNAHNPRLSVGAPTQELKPTDLPGMVSAPTRDLGLRPPLVKSTEETTAHHRMVPPKSTEETRHDVILPFDPIDARTAQILDEIDEGAPDREAKEDKTRRRITRLFERATQWSQAGELDRAVAAIDLALSEDPNSALGQKLVHRHRETMMQVFQAFLGDLDRQPILARPLHELANAPISPRAAFLLSRIDGSLTMDELLDVSGMPRIEAYRYLCQLFLRGILR